MKADHTDPTAEFSTLVEILRWRALQQPEQRTYTSLPVWWMEKQKGIIWAIRSWIARPGVLERCSKAT